jgi:signal transduction histidine kinase
MFNLKYLINTVLFFLPISLFAQSQINDSLFMSEIEKKISLNVKLVNFKKANSFYLKANWDSTMVYTMKQLNDKPDKEIANYCHFLRAFSFKKKKLLEKAKREFKFISSEFKFYYKVNILLGEIALEQEDFLNAKRYFEEVENLIDNDNFVFKKSCVLHNLGVCYINLEEYNKAEKYLFESKEIQEKDKDTLLLISTIMDIGVLYYLKNNSLKEAFPYFKEAYRLSKKIKDYEIKSDVTLNMSIFEELNNNFSSSLTYRKEFEQWKDSLNDQNKVWEVAELEKQFAVKQKQKQVTILEAENKQKIAERNGFLYSSVSLLLLFGAGTFFYRQKIKSNKIILAQKEALDELNATKDKLFSIVSHDLRSSVNALKTSNTKLQESLETKNYTQLDTQLNTNSAITNGAYNLLDNLLHWALLQTKQGYFEITSMRLFFIVEQVSYNYKPLLLDKNIDFENTVIKKDIIDADQESLKIILRNLLDNAIKFSNENGSIKVYSRDTSDNFCDLIIEDNGLGMSENTRLELLKDTTLLSKKENEAIIGTGLGMQLVKQMIQKNKGKFNIESELGKGTKMIVSLPKTATDG